MWPYCGHSTNNLDPWIGSGIISSNQKLQNVISMLKLHEAERKILFFFLFRWLHSSSHIMLTFKVRIASTWRAHNLTLIGTRILLVSILNYAPRHIVPLKSAHPNKKSDHKRPTYLKSMHFQFRGEKCATKTPSLKVTNHCTNLLIGFWSNEQGEPTTSYIWTHWAWETTTLNMIFSVRYTKYKRIHSISLTLWK
jgi:hypothetical protein